MNREICLIVPAAGSGRRFGEKKQFELLSGEPLLCVTVRNLLGAFEALREEPSLRDSYRVKSIVIAASKGDEPRVRELFKGLDSVSVVTGGESRFESVRLAYEAALGSELCGKSEEAFDVFAVHDACRPFVSDALILRLFFALEQDGADMAVPGLAIADTVKERKSLKNIDRDCLVAVQTPQIMWGRVADSIYAQGIAGSSVSMAADRARHLAADPHFIDEFTDEIKITDDASIATALGFNVLVSEGERVNFKITKREDFDLSERLAPGRSRGL